VPQSETDDMDFHHTETHLPPPLTPEHAALRANLQMIMGAAMDSLYHRITADTKKTVNDTVATLKRTNEQLEGQILSLNARVSVLQQQLLACQPPAQVPAKAPMAAPPKKTLKLKLAKKNAEADAAGDATATITSATPQAPVTNPRGWETVPPRPKTKPSTLKLIPTKYTQAEREVTCFFANNNTDNTISQPEKTYSERQSLADTALHRLKTAFVDYKDIFTNPFIRAWVTMQGAIVFTTGNDQSNVVYEDYISIIKHALVYYGDCERVEIGKRFSQFLLHGVPTHISIPDISYSISTNYPQLVQGQTPRWLTPPERRENKVCSTNVMTLTGNVKKDAIGR